MPWLLNFAAFQTLWLISAAGAANGQSLAGPLILLVWLPVHFWLSPCRKADSILVIGSALLGTLLDSSYQVLGWIDFHGTRLTPEIAPLWITTLWVNFALTLNHSLSFLQGRPLIAAVLGATGTPLAYYGGVVLGAAALTAPPWHGLIGIAACWLIACPALTITAGQLARRLDRHNTHLPS